MRSHQTRSWERRSALRDDVDYAAPMRGGPCDLGFDHFHGIAASLDMPPYAWIANNRLTEQPTDWHDGANGQTRPGPMAPDFAHQDVLDASCDHACEWIRHQVGSERPFFLYFPLTAPPTPILPAECFRGTSGLNTYGDFCLHVDDVVGRIMATLDACGVSEDTILVITSDNGCSPRADFPALAACGHYPSYHFRGMKADIYEGGHRIPLLIRWPRVIAAGSRCDALVSLGDPLATVAEIHGAELPDEAGEDSISNLPLWQGAETPTAIRERLLVHHSFKGAFTIRQGRWKLEMCPGSGGWSWPRPGPECDGLPPMQLYDLVRRATAVAASNGPSS